MKPPLPTAAEKRLAKRVTKVLFTDTVNRRWDRMELVEKFSGQPGWCDDAVEDEILGILAASRKRRPRAGKRQSR